MLEPNTHITVEVDACNDPENEGRDENANAPKVCQEHFQGDQVRPPHADDADKGQRQAHNRKPQPVKPRRHMQRIVQDVAQI